MCLAPRVSSLPTRPSHVCLGAASRSTCARVAAPSPWSWVAGVLARVLATEIDPLAAACARDNGVEVFVGDMAAALPDEVRGRVDVVTAVVPYVPSDELRLLPRDVVTFEPKQALDGGVDGTDLLRRAILESVGLLRSGGSLLLELGGSEADLLAPLLAERGFVDVRRLVDEEGDLRGLVCRRCWP
jgi:release factor glutamine methyltransferase